MAGSHIRVLSTSSRKCTVSAIDNHEIPGLDLVQCAALVQTNHGIFNLIMDDYVYYGRGHSMHSSGQIEWHTNIVDNKSVQVGGQQRIVTIDEYSMPPICKLKIDFPTPNQSRDIEVHTLFPTLSTMKLATIYLLNGILRRNLCNLHFSRRNAKVSSLPRQRGVTEYSQQN